MKAVVAAFNQEKALVGAFSVLMNLRMELFQALKRITASLNIAAVRPHQGPAAQTWAVKSTSAGTGSQTDFLVAIDLSS